MEGVMDYFARTCGYINVGTVGQLLTHVIHISSIAVEISHLFKPLSLLQQIIHSLSRILRIREG